MLIDIIFIRNDHVILRDVDGSEVSLTAEDAFTLFGWFEQHKAEVVKLYVESFKEKRDEQSQ